MIEQLDLLYLGNNRAVDSVIKAVIGEDLNPSEIVLLKKYLDFLNIFDKA